MITIHPTAIVSSKAEIQGSLKVGPYAIIEDDVVIGDNCEIGPHAVLYNGARLGKNIKIYQSASVANIPQDLKFLDEPSVFEIGDNTVIREFATLHRGTKSLGYSKIGKNCLVMAYGHVAHDSIIGDNCILANGVQIAGHVEVEDWVIIGGLTPVHQFCKIGKHAMIGGGVRVGTDIPPFVLAAGEPLRFNGLNLIGLKRRGFTLKQIEDLKDTYNLLFRSNLNISQAKERIIAKYPENENVSSVINFLAASSRGLIKG